MRSWILLFGTFATVASPLSAQRTDSNLRAGHDTLALSLADAVERSDQLGEEVRAAREQVRAADAQVTIARSQGLPQLRLNAQQNRTLASARGQAVGSLFNQPYTYTANATFTQTLFQGGKVIKGSRAASAFRQATQHELAEIRANTNLAVQQAYLQALFSARLVQIQQQAYDLAAARLKQAEQFEQGGRFSRYDVLRARVEVANLEPQLLQAREEAELALLEVKRLANIPEAQPIRLTTVIDSVLIANILTSVDTTVAPTQRPSLRAAELEARATKLGVSVAKADLWPTFSFTYQTGAGAFPNRGQGFPTKRGEIAPVPCPPGSDPSRVCTEQNGGWFGDRSFAFVISWPIFDGLRTKGAIDAAATQARLAAIQLANTRELVYNEFARAKTALARAQAQYAARRQNVAEAREAYDLAALRYSRGLGTQIDVSDAQLALTTAETNEARAVYDLYLAIVTLARVQGRQLPLPSSNVSGS
jgi:outer membrane protein TolC